MGIKYDHIIIISGNAHIQSHQISAIIIYDHIWSYIII